MKIEKFVFDKSKELFGIYYQKHLGSLRKMIEYKKFHHNMYILREKNEFINFVQDNFLEL